MIEVESGQGMTQMNYAFYVFSLNTTPRFWAPP